jgi:hypothetical protein
LQDESNTLQRKNLTEYLDDNSAKFSSASVSSELCGCCNRPSNENCSVRVGVGVNLQYANYGTDAMFVYDLSSPKVSLYLRKI